MTGAELKTELGAIIAQKSALVEASKAADESWERCIGIFFTAAPALSFLVVQFRLAILGIAAGTVQVVLIVNRLVVCRRAHRALRDYIAITNARVAEIQERLAE